MVFGAFLVEKFARFVVDRITKGPERRSLKSKVTQIGDLRDSLVSLPVTSVEGFQSSKDEAEYFKSETEIGILAPDLKALGIETPPFHIWEPSDRSIWIEYLSRLVVNARYGRLESAISDGLYYGNPIPRDDALASADNEPSGA